MLMLGMRGAFRWDAQSLCRGRWEGVRWLWSWLMLRGVRWEPSQCPILVGHVLRRRQGFRFNPPSVIHRVLSAFPRLWIQDEIHDTDWPRGGAGDGTEVQKETFVGLDSPRLRPVDVGDPTVGGLGVGDHVADPRLPERGDDETPRRRPFVGVDDRRQVLGERLPPLGTGRSGSGSRLVGDEVADNVVERLIRLLDADTVGRLVPDEVLHPPKNVQVEGLGEV